MSTTDHSLHQEDRLSTTTTAPFRADHVGSLLRPPALTQARADFKAGRLDADGLHAVEDAAILEVIEMQRAAGLQSVTDGELRRTSWHMDFIYQLQGISQVDGESLHVQFKNAQGTYDYAPPAMRVSGKVALGHTIFADAFSFLRDHANAGQTPKLTIPSPSMVHYRGGNAAIDRDVYPDIDEFWSDLATAYRQQISAVYELGCRYLQLDDTSLAYVNDPAQREHIVAIGGDPEHLHEQYIEVINRALEDKPADLTVTTHLCRGNNQSMWAAEGGYDFVAEALFGKLGVNGYFLEFDDARSGGFEPLRYLPKGDKRVILGIVTTKRAELEDKDLLKRRIEDAAQYVDIDQLGISGQCGFSSTEEGNNLTIDEQKAKLELIVEVADEVWGS
ncbi:MAG TPA: 5-methyltetrahydropteroyltriglutamate--homocysteine S-methyltransferase [Solirubrobacteraceae bacterium]|jgi:5-methyltetrahydropteroyltriglutamate--homocysteine methyltransferase|nr:5-methyltetrahydropteroyltriglutamate--homocysteine S-methyltransferase [Solirubrobacteraceae bacterium]